MSVKRPRVGDELYRVSTSIPDWWKLKGTVHRRTLLAAVTKDPVDIAGHLHYRIYFIRLLPGTDLSQCPGMQGDVAVFKEGPPIVNTAGEEIVDYTNTRVSETYIRISDWGAPELLPEIEPDIEDLSDLEVERQRLRQFEHRLASKGMYLGVTGWGKTAKIDVLTKTPLKKD